MENLLFRISTQEELEEFKKTGILKGGDLDIQSGFIHLSKPSQVAEVLEKFMSGRTGLHLLSFDPAKLGDGLKYEEVKDMEGVVQDNLFPHFYGTPSIEAVLEVYSLEVQDGKHLLPF